VQATSYEYYLLGELQFYDRKKQIVNKHIKEFSTSSEDDRLVGQYFAEMVRRLLEEYFQLNGEYERQYHFLVILLLNLEAKLIDSCYNL